MNAETNIRDSNYVPNGHVKSRFSVSPKKKIDGSSGPYLSRRKKSPTKLIVSTHSSGIYILETERKNNSPSKKIFGHSRKNSLIKEN